MTKASPARAAKRTGVVRPTELTMTEAHREAFMSFGVPGHAIDQHTKNRGQAGISQEAFDAENEVEIAQQAEAKAANDKARAEAKAEERRQQKAAFAGMALQGLVSRADRSPEYPAAHAKQAVALAEALVQALEAE